TSAVGRVLGDAEGLREQARKAPVGQLGKWAEARLAGQKARELLDQEKDLPGLSAFFEQVDEFLASVDAEEKVARESAARAAHDRATVAEVDGVRLAKIEVAAGDMVIDNSRVAPLYEKAFRKHGLELADNGVSVADAAARLRRTTIHARLLSALDDWV